MNSEDTSGGNREPGTVAGLDTTVLPHKLATTPQRREIRGRTRCLSDDCSNYPFPAPVPTQEQSAQLTDASRRTTAAFRTLADPLSASQLAWAPPGGGWGVGQVLEHLVTVNGLYLQLCEALVARGLAVTPPATTGAWKASFVGGFLARAVAPESTRKLPAPKVFRPGPAPRANVLPVFLEMQERLASLVERAAPLDWNALRGPSPVSPLIRVNLGDAFQILVNHSARHLGQAQRVAALGSFPRT